MTGVWIHLAATSLKTQRLASDLVTNPLTFLCFCIFVPPTYLVPTASCAANMHNNEGWTAGITDTTVREEDVHDRDPVRQGHASAFLFTPSAVTCESLACQLCLHSLRPPRSSLVPHSWSVASLQVLSPPTPLPRTTRFLDVATKTFPHTAASRDVSTQLSFMESLASSSTLDALCPACARSVPSLLLDVAVQTPLYSVASHDASTQLPLTEFFIGSIYSNDPLDRQASSAHCNDGSASPPQPADIATLCSPSSASHAGDGHEGTTAPRVSPQPPPGLGKYARQCASHGETCQNGTRATSSVKIYLSHAPTATCQYHPCGNASYALSYYIQDRCKYRPSGNPQSCWCRSSCRNWSSSQTTSPGSSYGQIWSIQT